MVSNLSKVEGLLGTYLDPPHLVALDFPEAEEGSDALKAFLTERGHVVVRAIALVAGRVRITHSGGLFLPGTMLDLRQRPEDFAEAFNLVICNLALAGAAQCGPVSRRDLGFAKPSGDEVFIGASSGPKQILRNAAVVRAVREGDPFVIGWPRIASEDLERAVHSDAAQRLADISPTLPELVAAAYFHARWARPAEALVAAYIVVEQVLGHIWRHRIEPDTRGARHRERLKDSRTFSAAVKTEVLWRAGLLTDEAFDHLERARSARNRLAHDAQLVEEADVLALRALNVATQLGRLRWQVE